jgi:hypothetical protein
MVDEGADQSQLEPSTSSVLGPSGRALTSQALRVAAAEVDSLRPGRVRVGSALYSSPPPPEPADCVGWSRQMTAVSYLLPESLGARHGCWQHVRWAAPPPTQAVYVRRGALLFLSSKPDAAQHVQGVRDGPRAWHGMGFGRALMQSYLLCMRPTAADMHAGQLASGALASEVGAAASGSVARRS